MIEGGFGETPMGKTILAACFITDLGTVLALGTLFADFNFWLLVFVVVTAVVLWFMPGVTRFIIARLGATRQDEWTTHRLTGAALRELAAARTAGGTPG